MISIIVPVWNQHEMTAECLESVALHTSGYELIVVDNGSDPPIGLPTSRWVDASSFGDGMRRFFPTAEDGAEAFIIRNEENLGFPAAVNQGVQAARGDAVVLLNNDVVVTPGWAERLVSYLDRFSIVGPLTNYCAGIQRTVIPVYEDEEQLYTRAYDWAEEHSGKSSEVNWVIGFCFAFRRPLFDEIGEFDESMWPTSGEEIDFCLRARAAGHRIGIAKDVYVHHEGSQTFKAMEGDGILSYAEMCAKTNKKLADKWGASFWFDQKVQANGDGLRINLGCGKFKLPGFVNIDMQPEVEPDLIADVTALPYEDDSVDEIYAGHLLEHFDWIEGGNALRYWHRILKPGGRIAVTVPDFDVIARKYMENPTADRLRDMNDTYIYSHKQTSPHRYAYSAALLMEALAAAGFKGLERLPEDHPYYPYPVDWQVGFRGVKS